MAIVVQEHSKPSKRQRASHFTPAMQSNAAGAVNAETGESDIVSLSRCCCTMMILNESFASVRGYGLRAYEPRQSRNAATVV